MTDLSGSGGGRARRTTIAHSPATMAEYSAPVSKWNPADLYLDRFGPVHCDCAPRHCALGHIQLSGFTFNAELLLLPRY